jgi:hypothetical protein
MDVNCNGYLFAFLFWLLAENIDSHAILAAVCRLAR